MPRKLPWLQSDQTGASSPDESIRTVKRRRVEDDSLSSDTASSLSRHSRQRPGREPSTSPPREPPGEEFMRDGIEQDDLYRMVEDEFLAVAQSFTQHLHHAEYIRLKNLISADKQSMIDDIARPTDNITTMRAQLQKKNLREDRAAKTKAALQKMGLATDKKNNEDSDLSDDEGLWDGTALKGFMTGPRKTQASLTGLHGIKSATRAAAGFSKAQTKPSPTRVKQIHIRAGSSSVQDTISKSSKSRRHVNFANEESTTGDDDDLDDIAPCRIRQRSTVPVKVEKESPPAARTIFKGLIKAESPDPEVIPSHDQDRSRFNAGSKTSKAPGREPMSSHRPTFKFDLSDDDDEDSKVFTRRPALKSTSKHSINGIKSTRIKHSPDQGENKKRDRTQEIPTFLV
ncbi:MAG: hypothetical protein M1834_007862 [Cirrosporium novae-zelandiae]|nr:MAG: hypothetical protein M1834_007862 [Cirrosporium novae-zelandiae]